MGQDDSRGNVRENLFFFSSFLLMWKQVFAGRANAGRSATIAEAVTSATTKVINVNSTANKGTATAVSKAAAAVALAATTANAAQSTSSKQTKSSLIPTQSSKSK